MVFTNFWPKIKGQVICTLLLIYFGKMVPPFIRDINACKFTHMAPKIQNATSIAFDFRALKCKGKHKTQWGKSLLQ